MEIKIKKERSQENSNTNSTNKINTQNIKNPEGNNMMDEITNNKILAYYRNKENKILKSKFNSLSRNLIRYIFDYFSFSKIRELLNLNSTVFKSLRENKFLEKIEERTLGLSNVKEVTYKPKDFKLTSILSIEHAVMNYEICFDLDLIILHLNDLENQLSIWTLNNFVFKTKIIERDESNEIMTNRLMKYIPSQKMLVVSYNTGELFFYKISRESDKDGLSINRRINNENTIQRNIGNITNNYDFNEREAKNFLDIEEQNKENENDKNDNVSLRMKFKRKINEDLIVSLHYCNVSDQLITIERTIKVKNDDVEISFIKFWNCITGKHVKTKTYLDKSVCHFNIMNSDCKNTTTLFFGNTEGSVYYHSYEKIFYDNDNNLMIFYNHLPGESEIMTSLPYKNDNGFYLIVSYANGNVITWDINTKTQFSLSKFDSELYHLDLFSSEDITYVTAVKKGNKIVLFDPFSDIEVNKSGKVEVTSNIFNNKNDKNDFNSKVQKERNSGFKGYYEFTTSSIPIAKLTFLNSINKNNSVDNSSLGTFEQGGEIKNHFSPLKQVKYLMLKNVDFSKVSFDFDIDKKIIDLNSFCINSHKSVVKSLIYDSKNKTLLTIDNKGELKVWSNVKNKFNLIKSIEPTGSVKLDSMIILRGETEALLGINGTKTIFIYKFDKFKIELVSKADEPGKEKYVSLFDMNNGYSFLVGKTNGEIDFYTYNNSLLIKRKAVLKHMPTEKTYDNYLSMVNKNKEVNHKKFSNKENKIVNMSNNSIISVNEEEKEFDFEKIVIKKNSSGKVLQEKEEEIKFNKHSSSKLKKHNINNNNTDIHEKNNDKSANNQDDSNKKPEFVLKKQKITCIRSFVYKETNYIVSGASDGSLCFFDSKKLENTYYLEGLEPFNKQIKQIIKFINEYNGKELIMYLNDYQGSIVIKDFKNEILKFYNNDRDIIYIERLNPKCCFYIEKDSNKINLVSTKKLLKRLRVFQQIALKFDPYITRYINDGETIFSFGYDFCDGEPSAGKGIDFIKLKKKIPKKTNCLFDMIVESDAEEDDDDSESSLTSYDESEISDLDNSLLDDDE